MPDLKLHPAAEETLRRWHDAVARKDPGALGRLLHPEVVFRSPAAHQPYASAPVVAALLGAVMEVLEDFTYHRQLATGDGLDVALEFSGRVGDRGLKGVDLIRFDAQGRVIELEVLVRPLSGLQALAGRMAERLGPALAALGKG